MCAILLPASLAEAGLFDPLEYRSVGPVRGGRVTAVAGTAVEPGTFYLGASGGGVWKSTDFGTSWSNVSDGFFATPSIGDIAVSQSDANVLYVGTGSDGLRSNVILGKGVYKSNDAGTTWTHLGLDAVGQIGAVEIDPRNNNVAWVAAIGQPFRANDERGVYKTEDGGQSWNRVFSISDQVGFADLELIPANPEVVLAAAWRGERKPWTIISGGSQAEGGVFKTDDGGDSWRRITSGLPTGLIGKIDLAVSAADSRVVYALVEAPGDDGGLYRSDDQGESFVQVSSKKGLRSRPFYYTNVEADPSDPDTVYVMATGYYRSKDGGVEWEKLTPPHGDNHDMWINPDNSDLFIQGNDGGANVTFNAGETWSSQFNQVTSELYQVEVDDQYPYWLYAGMQDNGSTISVPSRAPYRVQSRDAWFLETGGCETGPAVPKPGDHNTVYANCKGRFGVFDKRTGTERRYYVGAANMYGQNPSELDYRFQRVSPIHVSPHNPDVVYHGSQSVHRTTNDGETWETISPDLTAFEADKQVFSGSPITRDITGEEFYSTLYSLRESPVEEGVIWTGANDGPVYVTRNGGESWEDVTPRMPKGGRVDSVEPSPHDAAVAYVSVLRYQLGDDAPYAYRTDNYGRSWTRIADGKNGIPADFPVRVVREDPERSGLLFAGTEYGLFVSLDAGKRWKLFQQNLPVTPITDLKIHRGDLVVSTMGRGFWVLDKVAALRALDADVEATADIARASLLAPDTTIRYRQTFTQKAPDPRPAYPQPAAMIDYLLPKGVSAPVKLEILNAKGELVNAFASGGDSAVEVVDDMMLSEQRFSISEALGADAGWNRFAWDMRYRGAWQDKTDKPYETGPLAAPGTYTLRLHVGDEVIEQTLSLVIDPRVAAQGIDEAAIALQLGLQQQIVTLLSDARSMVFDIEEALAEEDLEDAAKAALEEALADLKTEEGTYMKPKLVSQIQYLYRILNKADQVPGGEASTRFTQLLDTFEGIQVKVSSLL